ncbi:hypothetical protein PWP93_00725 [Paraburkholderia sp. A1RI-2L]
MRPRNTGVAVEVHGTETVERSVAGCTDDHADRLLGDPIETVEQPTGRNDRRSAAGTRDRAKLNPALRFQAEDDAARARARQAGQVRECGDARRPVTRMVLQERGDDRPDRLGFVPEFGTQYLARAVQYGDGREPIISMHGTSRD